MKKKVRKEEKRKAPQLRLVDVVRRGLFEVIYDAGRQALEELLEEERARLCGSTAYERSSERGCYRAGSSPSQLVLGGRKVSVRRPRVRDEDGEVSLPAWQDMASEDPLTERIREQLMVGVSTRNYARSLETLPEDASSRSTSKSAVSRRFVSMTTMQLEAWMKRSLSELDLTIVFIDGIHIEDHVVLVALGVDTRGYKHVLGLWEGSTENAVVAKSLCEDLVERGLRPDRQMLFVLDGGKGLRRAVSDVIRKADHACSAVRCTNSAMSLGTCPRSFTLQCVSACAPPTSTAYRRRPPNESLHSLHTVWRRSTRALRALSSRASRRP